MSPQSHRKLTNQEEYNGGLDPLMKQARKELLQWQQYKIGISKKGKKLTNNHS